MKVKKKWIMIIGFFCLFSLILGGTALAAAALIEKLGAEVVEMAFIVNLPDIGGEAKLKKKGYEVFSLTEFEGE